MAISCNACSIELSQRAYLEVRWANRHNLVLDENWNKSEDFETVHFCGTQCEIRHAISSLSRFHSRENLLEFIGLTEPNQ